ncbi:MAG TPA: NusA-like transcription termination signal-binding factor [Candidatus Binatia bacterium]|nr:NusA-like transcription termination signal-binding factor [Candidatus Binatia bacterium]
MAIKFGMDEIKFMSLLEQFSGVSPKDIINEEEKITFVIPAGSIARCIGKGGVVVKKLENLLKKKVKYVEFSDQLIQFIKNAVAPLELANVEEEGGVVVMTAADHQTRGMLIGRSAMNLRATEALVKRYFPITELKVA